MADIAHVRTDERLEELEKKVKKTYQQAHKEVEQKTLDYFRRFRVKDDLKRDQLARGVITQKEYSDWRFGQMCIGRRWRELTENLSIDYHNANLIARQLIADDMPDVYAMNYNWGIYQVEHDAEVDLSWTLYNRKTVETLMRDNPKLLPDPSPTGQTAKKLAENKDLKWNYQHVNNAITQGVLQGESIPQIARRLRHVTDMNTSASIRNARTMMTCAENKGRQDAYDDLKERGAILREKWISTLDKRVRHSHQLLHGTYKDPETGEYDNGLAYPGDPDGDPEEVYNCRCCEIAEVEGFSIDTPTHSPKMGSMSYDEWLYMHGAPEKVWWYNAKYGGKNG